MATSTPGRGHREVGLQQGGDVGAQEGYPVALLEPASLSREARRLTLSSNSR